MSLIEAKAVWKRTDCSVTLLMISYLLVVEQHRTQIVIHALLKCQQENLYRSEERFSRNAETDLVCRLLLEKKNGWEKFTPERLASEVQQGHPVFLDFTAEWCIT